MKQTELRDKALDFIASGGTLVPFLECHIYPNRLDYILSKISRIKGIAGIDGDGVMDVPGESRRGINHATVERVAMMLAKFSALFNLGIDQFKRSTYWRGSYGLKHAFEDFSEKIGHDPHYVSNGDFIVAYLVYLHDLEGATDRELGACIRTDGSINAFIRMPRCFARFEEMLRGGRAVNFKKSTKKG